MGNTAPDDGWRHRGRGLPQITGKKKHETFGLADAPEEAAEMPTAIRILFDGMIRGMLPARSSPTVSPVNDDPVGARKIVNGTDCRLLSQLPRRPRDVAGAICSDG
ncbi:hypothetical protein B9J07_29065 [Sinorhizobium sp. LM21]|nr:hypothetical protein B9J07_29065 [Sinorhizobium sp. LM21]